MSEEMNECFAALDEEFVMRNMNATDSVGHNDLNGLPVALDDIPDSHSFDFGEEERDMDNTDPNEIMDEVSEVEDPEYNPEYDSEYESSTDDDEYDASECFSEVNGKLLSKDKKILWSVAPSQGQCEGASIRTDLKMKPGPTKHAISRVDDIKSSFELFLPKATEKVILESTNLEGERVFGADNWNKLDWVDFQAFVGLHILAGVYRSKNEALLNLWDSESGRPIFRATMSLGNLLNITRVIRFDKHETAPKRRRTVRDKLAPIRDLWDMWVALLPLMYNPGPDISVDERLIAFRGDCPFRQFRPKNPSKYGITFWVACDAISSYVWNIQPYTGKAADGKPEMNQGMQVVLDLTHGLCGQNITCGNFFTSYELGQQLLKRNLTMVGTVRKNKPEIPGALLETKGRTCLSSKFAFTETHTLVSYIPKKRKNVVLMSTMHKDASVSDREKKEPNIMHHYNHTKGGVDRLDQLTSTYTCKRKTNRWPMVVFYSMIDVSAINAYVLWSQINLTWKDGSAYKRRLFLEELGKALVSPLIQRRQSLPRTIDCASLVKQVQEGHKTPAANPTQSAKGKIRRRCKICYPTQLKTSTVCQKCKIYICKSHSIITIHCPLCA